MKWNEIDTVEFVEWVANDESTNKIVTTLVETVSIHLVALPIEPFRIINIFKNSNEKTKFTLTESSEFWVQNAYDSKSSSFDRAP